MKIRFAFSIQLLPFTFFAYITITTAAEICYFPDKSVANTYSACNSTAASTPDGGSACCLAQNNAYCTDSGLCLTDGILSRGACTDPTFAAPGCPKICTLVAQTKHVNVFPCRASDSTFACGTGSGPSDCSSGFTLPSQHIILRDDQQPGGIDAVQYADPNVTFVDKTTLSPSTSCPAKASSSEPSSSSSTSARSASLTGLAVGLPLAILFLASLSMNYIQHRHYQRALQRNPTVTKLLVGHTAKSRRSSNGTRSSSIARAYNTQVGELPTSWHPTEISTTVTGSGPGLSGRDTGFGRGGVEIGAGGEEYGVPNSGTSSRSMDTRMTWQKSRSEETYELANPAIDRRMELGDGVGYNGF